MKSRSCIRVFTVRLAVWLSGSNTSKRSSRRPAGLRWSPCSVPGNVGKTTLAQVWAQQHAATYLDLESPRDLNRLANPEMMLDRLPGPVVIDEVQAMPALLPILRVLADRKARAVAS